MTQKNDERLTLNGDEDDEDTSTPHTKDLIQAVRWSARALGKIEGLFDRIVQNSEASQRQMTQEMGSFHQDLELVRSELSEVGLRLKRLEGKVADLRRTNDELISECNRKWEQNPSIDPDAKSEVNITTVNHIKNPVLRVVAGWKPVYIALVVLALAIVLMIISQSEGLQELLKRFFG